MKYKSLDEFINAESIKMFRNQKKYASYLEFLDHIDEFITDEQWNSFPHIVEDPDPQESEELRQAFALSRQLSERELVDTIHENQDNCIGPHLSVIDKFIKGLL